MRTLKIVCVVLGVLHAAVMTTFALGPELAPLMVYIVDYPIAHFTAGGDPPIFGYGFPIVICSILYPAIIFGVGALTLRIFRKKSLSLRVRMSRSRQPDS